MFVFDIGLKQIFLGKQNVGGTKNLGWRFPQIFPVATSLLGGWSARYAICDFL